MDHQICQTNWIHLGLCQQLILLQLTRRYPLLWVYEPYGMHFPKHQTQLLLLWDKLGIPHKLCKQVHGSPLTIIRISINTQRMTPTLLDNMKKQLVNELKFWIQKPPKSSSSSFKLKYWEQMVGWFNWALNMYPLFHPALNNVYAKTSRKQNWEQQIYINNAIRDEFLWALTHIENSDSVHLIKSFSWCPSLANFVIFCDACPEGLGFWYPVSKDSYHAPTPVNVPSNVIFYFETLCMLSTLNHIQTKAPKGSKILIYTDNKNAVDIFQSLKCLPVYNHLLKSAVDILIKNDYSLHVLHVPGKDKIVADALSWVKFSVALLVEPKLKFYNFNPPSLVTLVGPTKWFIVTPDLVSQLGQLGLKINFSKTCYLVFGSPVFCLFWQICSWHIAIDFLHWNWGA